MGEVQNSCIECHEGTADIRDRESGMMQAILQKAVEAGVKGNDCVDAGVGWITSWWRSSGSLYETQKTDAL